MKDFFNSRLFITILIIAFLVFTIQWGYNKYINLQTQIRISEQNESALKDSLRLSENKLKQSEYSKQILVAENTRDLKRLNEKMAEKYSKLEGKISSLTNTVIQLNGAINNMDSLVTGFSGLSDPNPEGYSTGEFTWNYDKVFDNENSRSLAGKTTFKVDSTGTKYTDIFTDITKDIINFEITQGLRTRDDGKVEMFATSNYPGFTVSELNSILINPETHPALKQFYKRKKFSLGIYTGVGGTINLSDYRMIFGPQFGVGTTWHLFW
jgi:predicted RND superfamily exporter protein